MINLNTFFNSNIVNFGIGFLSSMSASAAFIFAVFKFGRPSIKISESIAKSRDSFDPENRMCYWFKIVNLSRYNAYDIKIELNKIVVVPAVNGNHKRFTEIKLVNSSLDCLPAYERNWKKKEVSDFAAMFRTYEDVEEILSKDLNSIEIQLTLKHQITGLSKVFNHKYVGKACVRTGKFHAGNDTNVA